MQHCRRRITPWPQWHEAHCSSGSQTITTSVLENPGACGHWCAICPSRRTRWPLADSSGRTARLVKSGQCGGKGPLLLVDPDGMHQQGKKVLWVLCKMPAHVVKCLVALTVRRDMLMEWWWQLVAQRCQSLKPAHHPMYRFRHMWLQMGTLASGGKGPLLLVDPDGMHQQGKKVLWVLCKMPAHVVKCPLTSTPAILQPPRSRT